MSKQPEPITFANTRERESYYGVTGAALRKWRAKGEAAGDPFPESNPVEVVAWYQRNYSKSAPQPLLLAAANFAAAAKKRKPKKSNALEPGGLTEALDRARRIEAYCGNLLEDALRAKDKEEIELHRGPYLKAQAALRDLEKAAVDIAKKRRELIERNAVVSAWASMHGHLPRAITRALLAAKPEDLTDEVWSAKVRAAMDKAMELMPSILPEILAGPPATEETEPEITA